ncbi:MAG: DEAD/DEAH box helicase family protein, partial [Steroidobacteraceae bacterium]|nr:DEAD/DEAH box helicase family protein [Steroidobacteraceae bacterium]
MALDTPLRRVFDYRPPTGIRTGDLRPGCRVRVPFGAQSAIGVITAVCAASTVPASRLRTATELIDTEPVFDRHLLRLLNWAAGYYHHPLGQVFAAALPRLAREGASARHETEFWSVTPAGAAALAAGEPHRAARQRALLQRLVRGGATAEELDASGDHDWRRSARALRKRGWIVASDVAPPPVPCTATAVDPATVLRERGPDLSAAQDTAVATIRAALGRYRALLLRGVTGSGKTEVYLQAAAAALERGEQVLVLVPEISLTPQLVQRFAARFTAPLAVLHSGLTDAQRLAAWRDCLAGRPAVVLGTRSAVFVPLAQPGLIIVD